MIIGNKIILRYPKVSDSGQYFEIITSKDIELFNPLFLPASVNDEKKWVRKLPLLRKKKELFAFSIIEKISKEIIGGCSLNVCMPYKRAEIAVWIVKKYQGKGYGSEVERLLIKFGFEVLKLNRIHGTVLVINNASISVLKKLGFKLEGTLRAYEVYKNNPADCYMYSILRSEWKDANNNNK